MCKRFVKNFRKPGADQKGVAASKMAGVFLKLLVWVLQHTKIVSENIDIDTLDAELFRGMNYQKKLEASWPNTLSEKYYSKANLGDAPQTF